jgi:hypothetical protein
MRSLLCALPLAILAIQPALAADGEKPTIAVMDLSPSNVPAGDAVIVSGFIRAAVVRSGKFVVVEKNNMDKVLAEQAFQQTGCTTSDCAVKLGRLLNTRKMVIGEFALLGGIRFLTASLVDVETGAIERTARVKGFEVGTADEAADRLVSQLTGVAVAPGSEAMGAAPPPAPVRKKSARELKTEWTFGVFGASGYGFVAKKAFTERAWTGSVPSDYRVSVLPEDGHTVSVIPAFFNIGVRVYPVRWLMVEGYYSPLLANFNTDIRTYHVFGTERSGELFQLKSHMEGLGGSAVYVLRVHPRLHLMAGAGACLMQLVADHRYEDWRPAGGPHFQLWVEQSPESMVVPYGLIGIQWMTPGPGLALWARYASGDPFKTTGRIVGIDTAGETIVNESLAFTEAGTSGLYLNFSLGYYF